MNSLVYLAWRRFFFFFNKLFSGIAISVSYSFIEVHVARFSGVFSATCDSGVRVSVNHCRNHGECAQKLKYTAKRFGPRSGLFRCKINGEKVGTNELMSCLNPDKILNVGVIGTPVTLLLSISNFNVLTFAFL